MSKTQRLLLAGSALAGLFLAGAAAAQQAPPSEAAVDEVVVTGTRIKTNTTSNAPLTVVSADAIANSGTLSLADIVKKDPALGSSTRGPSQTLNGGGSSGVDMRNLGNRRTLVLVNGRRFSIFTDEVNNTIQDVGMIPAFLIKRAEVLRDGASTTYGADAVAGVVNFLLNDDFDGARLDSYYGVSSRGDGRGVKVSGLMGVGNDRGHLVFGAQYQKQDSIPQDARGWATNLLTTLGNTIAYNSPNTPGGAVLSTTGAVIACYPNAGGANVAPNCPRFDASVDSDLILGTTLKSIGGMAKYQVSDDVQFYAQSFYSQRNSHQRISGVQVDTSTLIGPFTSGFTIPATNANNPYGQAVRLRFRADQQGPAVNKVDSQQYWTTLGFNGKLFDRFDWDVSGTRSETKSVSRRENIPNVLNLFNLLNPASCAADPICAPVGAIPNIADFLSQQTPLTAAQRNYLFFATTINSHFVTQQGTATISGPLFDLPAGTVKGAIGYEHRDESGVVNPDSVTQTTATGRSIVFPTDGRFHTDEGFGELQIPLLRDLPLVHSLDLNLQGRYSYFSNFKGAKTYKIGVDWAVTQDVRIRGGYGTSFRAPDVLELFGGGVGSLGTAIDPCNAGGQRALSATVNANCTALGLPANYTQVNNAQPTRSGGNPGLNPERGRTYTVGLVFAPQALPGFAATLDYFDVRIKDAIASGNLSDNLAACYADAAFATRANNPNDVCFGYNVRAGNALGRLNNPLLNLNQLTTSGIDATVNYRSDLGFAPGAVDVSLRGSWLGSYKQNAQELSGKFINGVNGNLSYPTLKGTLDVTYLLGDWSARVTANMINKMTDSAYGVSIPATNPLGYGGTPAYVSYDMLVKWRAPSGWDLALGVNNLLDKDPPYAFVSTRNTLPSTYDQIGRYFFITVGKSF